MQKKCNFLNCLYVKEQSGSEKTSKSTLRKYPKSQNLMILSKFWSYFRNLYIWYQKSLINFLVICARSRNSQSIMQKNWTRPTQ